MFKNLFISLLILTILFLGCSMDVKEPDTTVNNYVVSVNWKGEFSTPPAEPEIGWAYYDTTKKTSFIWDGVVWNVISKDGKSIEWQGELSEAPSTPKENWAYYNIIDGNSYIYDGQKWNYLAKSGRDGAAGIMLWLGSLDKAPASPSNGYCYYNTVNKTSYIWDGDSWEIIAKDGLNGSNGVGVIWKGASETVPLNPQLNWAYFNTVENKSFIWDGNQWQLFAETIGGDTNVVVSINWLGTFASAPTNPKLGQAYYNSTTRSSYIYDGTVWQQIAKDGKDGDGAVDGYLINWKGSLEIAPSTPKAGWAYYNSKEKKSYIYDGYSWQILAQDGTGSVPEGGIYDPDNKTYLQVLFYVGEKQNTQFYNQKFSEVNFGTVGINNSLGASTFYIGTHGKNNIKLTGSPAIQISGKDSDSFRVVQPKNTTAAKNKFIMDANIYFCPTSIGEKTATITIKNNSDDVPNFSFVVKGNCEYWPKNFDGGEGDGEDSVLCSAEDSMGNLYFAGYGFELVNNHSGFDCWVKKFDKEGLEDTANWNKKISIVDEYGYRAEQDCIKKIEIDSEDNVILATPNSIMKYSSMGQEIWKKDFKEDKINDLYLDKNDNVYITFEKKTVKLSSVGIELFSLPVTGKIRFDNNNGFILFRCNYIQYFNEDGSIKNNFVESVVFDKGWVNTTTEYKKTKYWCFDVKEGTKYFIQANSKGADYGDKSKTGNFRINLYYKSNNNFICTDEDANSLYSRPYEFTANQDGLVIMETYSVWSNYEGTIGFRIYENSLNSNIINLNRIFCTPFEVNDVSLDMENNIYFAGYDSLNNNFERKNARIVKYDSNGKLVPEWNKTFDWNHCEDEVAAQILFDGTKIIFVGNGNDIINGSSKNDTWIKYFDKTGKELKSFIIDYQNGYILNKKTYEQLYVYSQDFSSSGTINKIDSNGHVIKDIGETYVYNGNYLISDNYVYLSGAKSNLISPTSNGDWYISRLEK